MFDYLAVDWGSKRIGIAFGDSTSGLVLPFQNELLTSNWDSALLKIIEDKKTTYIVLGLPTNFNNQPTKISEEILRFKTSLESWLQNHSLTMHVILYNERGTTSTSKQQRSDISKDDLNQLSAVNLLPTYFKYELSI